MEIRIIVQADIAINTYYANMYNEKGPIVYLRRGKCFIIINYNIINVVIKVIFNKTFKLIFNFFTC